MSDTTTTVIPSAEELAEIARNVRDSKKGLDRSEIKKNLKYLNTDNTWNKEGILQAFDEREDEMVFCAGSGVPLFYTDREGRRYPLESFGYCEGDGLPYHRDLLSISDDVSKAPYPIQYEGCYSIAEWKKPLTAEESAELMEKYGI